MVVQDLTREQMDKLKAAYFWQEETQDVLPDDIIIEQIPDDIIIEHYSGVCFVNDDFFCTMEEE